MRFLMNLRNSFISKYFIMSGNGEKAVKSIDFKSTPVYCLGFAEEIHFAEDDEATNQALRKLKEKESTKMYKYRIKNRRMFNYFLRFGEVELRIQPQKSKEIKFVIISMLKRQSFKVQHILNILKKELNIQGEQTFLIFQDGKLRQSFEPVTFPKRVNYDEKIPIVYLQYLKQQVLG